MTLTEYSNIEKPNGLDGKFQVIFHLRWSDIFDKSKVILKPSVSVILYLPLNCAKHNITRCKPNITAQQYNSPKANITEKRHLMSNSLSYCLAILAFALINL